MFLSELNFIHKHIQIQNKCINSIFIYWISIRWKELCLSQRKMVILNVKKMQDWPQNFTILHQFIESVSPLLESGLVLWHVLTYYCTSYILPVLRWGLQEPWIFALALLEPWTAKPKLISQVNCQQAKVSLTDFKRPPAKLESNL